MNVRTEAPNQNPDRQGGAQGRTNLGPSLPLRVLIIASPTLYALIGLAPSASGDDATALKALQDRVRSAAARLRPSLVRIETVGGTQPSDAAPIEVREAEDEGDEPKRPRRSQRPFRDTVGSGFVVSDGPTTGFVWSADGTIVTSSFNFARDPALITVTLADGRRLAADLVARDQVRKIALLKVDAENLPVPEWADEAEVRVGQTVVALGLGFGTDEPSINVGIISARSRMKGNAVQTDAKLSPANFGGPLCDLSGRVVGLNVPMAQRPGELAGAEMYDSGVGFAVTKKRLDPIVAELMTGRSIRRGWLGFQIDARVKTALVVGEIADPSPVKTAGLKPGDTITAINGQKVSHYGHLMQALSLLPAGETVYLQIQRGEAEFSALAVLASSDELGPMPDVKEPFDPSDPMESAPETPEEQEP